MKLNLDKQLVNLKGIPFETEKLSDVLANVLAMSTQGKPAKMITWAVNLTNNGEIDIEKADLRFIAGLVEGSSNVINLAKAQLLDELEKAEKEEKA